MNFELATDNGSIMAAADVMDVNDDQNSFQFPFPVVQLIENFGNLMESREH